MDTSPRPDPIRRRSHGTNRRPRRTGEPCEEETAAHRPLRVPGIAPPIITVRANERNRSLNLVPEPSPRLPPDETRAQIISLETQIERLQLRLLENRLRQNREETLRSSLRTEPDSTRLMSPFGNRGSVPLRVPGVNDASTRSPGGVRLSSSTAEGASGSAHNEEDERMPRSIQQRLGDFVRDHPANHNTPAPMFSPQLAPIAREIPRAGRSSMVDDSTFLPRRPLWRRRNSLADPSLGDPWMDAPIRSARLWRLEDSSQDPDSDLEPFPGPEPRRPSYDSQRSQAIRDHTRATTVGAPEAAPPNRPAEVAAVRDRLQATWRDFDPDEYASPIPSLFSWASSDRRRPEGGERPVPSTALDRTAAELVRSQEQPDSAARLQLQQLQLDLFRDVLNSSSSQRATAERFRPRRALREDLPPPPAASSSLDTQKGRPKPLEPEDMNLDCECKICFGQIADTVLLPCAHLVICQWCADQIGAKAKDMFVRHAAQVLCPMCRTAVVDRITVFRG